MPRTVDRQDVADREPPPDRHRPRVLGAVLVIGLVVGLIGLAVTVARLDPEDAPLPAADPSSRLSQWQEGIEDLKDAEAVRMLAAHYADSPPARNGPWPVTVVEDSSMGLEVRSRPTAGGHPVGAAIFGTTLWAWCRTGSGFDPGGGGDGWYQVAWPRQDRSGEFLVSGPDDEFRAWVHRRPTVPAGHSGEIPVCAE